MSKKQEKRIGNALAVLAIVSFAFTTFYGLYYFGRDMDNMFFYILTVIQNSVEAFAFKSSISFSKLADEIAQSNSIWYSIFVYLYGVACFTAPYCTLGFCYKILKRILNIEQFFFKHKNYRHIIIFGYNEEVKALLSAKSFDMKENGKTRKCRIHLVSADAPDGNEVTELMKKGVTVHRTDIIRMKKDKKTLDAFISKIELGLAENIILFDDSASRNFSIYTFLHAGEMSERLRDDVKVILRCEDDGIKKIIEDYHDSRLKNGETVLDLEIVNIPEIRVRKMLAEKPLHSYYLNSGEKDPNNWNLHLLIVGFGKLGQQVLMQALNLGVTGRSNRILIDVIDCAASEKKKLFEYYFDRDYITSDEKTISIDSDKCDGELLIRFTESDIRFGQFYEDLSELSKDGAFTYAAICVEDTDVSLQCLSTTKHFMKKYASKNGGSAGETCYAIRMDLDKRMAEYVNGNKQALNDVFAIEASTSAISLEALLRDDLDRDAKVFNHTYNALGISNKGAKENTAAEPLPEEEKKIIADEWKKLSLFRRGACRALSARRGVNKDIMSDMDLEKWFGKEGAILKYSGNTWTYDTTPEDFAVIQSDLVNYPVPSELSRMEHRRWVYYTASCGWGCTESFTSKKNDELKENPCLCTWDNLAKYLPGYCIYDLMPALYEYSRRIKTQE